MALSPQGGHICAHLSMAVASEAMGPIGGVVGLGCMAMMVLTNRVRTLIRRLRVSVTDVLGLKR